MLLRALARELQKSLKGEVKINEPLARYTTWRLGGPAELFCQPQNREELDICLDFAQRKGLPFHVMGNGSNILILDGGIRGMVITTRKWREMKLKNEILWASTGTSINELLKFAAKNDLGGLEFAAGIPATIGGAVVTNAGTPEGSLGDITSGVEVINPEGKQCYLKSKDITFSYRFSSLRQEGTVAAVELKLSPAGKEIIREKINAVMKYRKEKQPYEWPNAGSVFKNPPGYFAGQLIESVGAKGWRVGQAEVSTKHANFIINRGQVKAADVLRLIAKIREAVEKSTGIKLDLEIEIWGEGL